MTIATQNKILRIFSVKYQVSMAHTIEVQQFCFPFWFTSKKT